MEADQKALGREVKILMRITSREHAADTEFWKRKRLDKIDRLEESKVRLEEDLDEIGKELNERAANSAKIVEKDLIWDQDRFAARRLVEKKPVVEGPTQDDQDYYAKWYRLSISKQLAFPLLGVVGVCVLSGRQFLSSLFPCLSELRSICSPIGSGPSRNSPLETRH
jgi:hypothetical protein